MFECSGMEGACLKITSENIGGVIVVSSLPSFIDASNAMEFKAEISTMIMLTNRVLFDMSNVKFIDSAGWRWPRKKL